MPFAARRHRLAHGHELEHFEPGHLSFAGGQAFSPEAIQMQFIPEPAAQPTITEEPWMFEPQLRKLDLEAIEHVGRNLAVLGEQTDLFSELIGFIDHLQTLAPGGLLGVVDLTQMENCALGGVAGAQPAVFDDAPVAMNLAVFFASVETQKHLPGAQRSTLGERCGRAWVST